MKKDCVILGNGPSLNLLPLNMLDEMPSFGANYCPHQPTYYVCVDHDVLMFHHKDVYPLAAGAEIAFLAAKEAGTSNLYNLPNVQLVERNNTHFREERFFTGLTVTYVALKMAFYLGFEQVHLYGVDHSPDWSHYRADYPRGDMLRRRARMAEMEYHYALAQKVYTNNGREIINHSYPSKLDTIFPRQ